MNTFNRKMVSFRFGPEFMPKLEQLRELLSKKKKDQWDWAPAVTKTQAMEDAVLHLLADLEATTSDNKAVKIRAKLRVRSRIDRSSSPKSGKKRRKKLAS